MNVRKVSDTEFSVSDGTDTITLAKASYEDLFYAIPSSGKMDNGTLYRLFNDTICSTAEMRSALKRMIDRAGGINPALDALQANVPQVQP
ncbi:MAG: hypothetical protein HZA54_15805 [Planctomycetes bacterium]|nr:hypothetical protein [Planctomycetota bacterium]